jgi:hypothetical protein
MAPVAHLVLNEDEPGTAATTVVCLRGERLEDPA